MLGGLYAEDQFGTRPAPPPWSLLESLPVQTPAIDTEEIRVEIETLPDFDQKVRATIPADCIRKIVNRLTEGGMEHDDRRLAGLLTKICVDETIARQDAPPFWGQAFPGDGPPPIPAEGEDFTVEFLLDRMPDLKVPAFDEITIRKPVREITSEMVEGEIASQCIESGSSEIHAGPIEINDRVVVDIKFEIGGDESEPVVLRDMTGRLLADDAPVLLNGVPFPGLAAHLQGRSAGETFLVTMPVPAQIERGRHGDADHGLEITISKVERPTPISVDEVVAMYGSPSAAVLRKQIETSLRNRFEFEQISFMTEDLLRQLLADLDYTPPGRVLQARLREKAKSIFQSVKKRGGSDEDAKAAVKEIGQSDRDAIVEELRRRALCGVLRMRHDIKAEENEIQERIRQLASIHNRRPEELRAELVESGMITGVAVQTIELQITRLAIKTATLVEVDPATLA